RPPGARSRRRQQPAQQRGRGSSYPNGGTVRPRPPANFAAPPASFRTGRRPASARNVHWNAVTTYLDHAATTPVRPEVADAYARALQVEGNPSSLHAAGRAARRVLEESRESIAADLGADPAEVILTAGGTEADNLAVQGIWRAQARVGRPGLVTSAVEHHAVLETAHHLAEHEGAETHEIGVDATGVVRTDELAEHLEQQGGRTGLVSMMWANNEVGTIQPVEQVASLAHSHAVPVHSDAVQAVGQVPVDFAASGLAALSFSGHKLGAPIGLGALLARRELGLVPVQHGGGQERAVRSGTLPHASFAALAAAVHAAVTDLAVEAQRRSRLRDRLIAGVLEAVPDAELRGAPGAGRLPGNAHFTFSGADADALLFTLDAAGVCASSGSACQAGVQQPSHVLLAMGADDGAARSAVRLTVGWSSSEEDVEALLVALPEAVARARAAYRPRPSQRRVDPAAGAPASLVPPDSSVPPTAKEAS